MERRDLFLVSVDYFVVNRVPVQFICQELLDFLLDNLRLTSAIRTELILPIPTLTFISFSFDLFHKEHLDIVRFSVDFSDAEVLSCQLFFDEVFLCILDFSHSVCVEDDIVFVRLVLFRIFNLVFFFGFIFEESMDRYSIILDLHMIDWAIWLVT